MNREEVDKLFAALSLRNTQLQSLCMTYHNDRDGPIPSFFNVLAQQQSLDCLHLTWISTQISTIVDCVQNNRETITDLDLYLGKVAGTNFARTFETPTQLALLRDHSPNLRKLRIMLETEKLKVVHLVSPSHVWSLEFTASLKINADTQIF